MNHPTSFFMRAGRTGLCVGLLASGVPMRAAAQQVPSPASANPAPAEGAADYLVGPGDQISIMVYGVPELSQSARVSNSGKIHVAKVGIVNVYRMTPQQIASVVSAALTSKGLLNDPWVQVQVTEFRASTVYVLGEVFQPGQFAITSRMSLLDLISMAAGLTPQAEPVAFLYRLPAPRSKPDSASAGAPQTEVTGFTSEDVLPIDVVALSQGRKPELNMELRGGDVLYVRRSKPKYYFVVGEVSRPGLYELSEAYENKEVGAPLLLSQALSRAGGPVRTAKSSECLLVRPGPGGTLEQRPFDFDAVLRGRQPDWPIEVNDIIFVPGSNFKTVAYGLIGMLPNIVIAGSTQAMPVR